MNLESFFWSPERLFRRHQEILGTSHALITRIILERQANIVFQLPSDVMAPLIDPMLREVIESGIWGLKLVIEPVLDKGVEKTWIKELYV
jgi:hypothetical protein